MTGIPMVTILVVLIAIAFISCGIAYIYGKLTKPEQDNVVPNEFVLLSNSGRLKLSRAWFISMMPIPNVFFPNTTWPAPAQGRLACIKSFVHDISESAYGRRDIYRNIWDCNYPSIPRLYHAVSHLIDDLNTCVASERKNGRTNHIQKIGHPVTPSHLRKALPSGLSRDAITSLLTRCTAGMISARLCALVSYLEIAYFIRQDCILDSVDDLKMGYPAASDFRHYVRLDNPTICDLLTSMWEQLVVCDEEFTVDDAKSIIRDITSVFDIEPEKILVLFPTETMRRGDE